MDFGLAGRVYVVSGGTRGIGRAVVELLLAEGASVVTFARSVDACQRQGGAGDADNLHVEVCDVLDADGVRGVVDGAVARFGRLDGVVANAGAGVTAGVLGTPETTWSAQFTVKVAAALHLVEPAVPHLVAAGSGSVVVMNGVTAQTPDPSMAPVGAARAALANVAALLASELVAEGIRVNTINLGAITTDRQIQRHRASGSDADFGSWCAEQSRERGIPMGRFGQPEEVAPAVAFLLSDLASYITATTIDVAGGLGALTHRPAR